MIVVQVTPMKEETRKGAECYLLVRIFGYHRLLKSVRAARVEMNNEVLTPEHLLEKRVWRLFYVANRVEIRMEQMTDPKTKETKYAFVVRVATPTPA